MTNREFEQLVARLEAQALRRPWLYKMRVLALALLGYGYIAFMLVGLLLTSVISVVALKALGAKLALGLLVLMWMVLKALWVKLDAPQGRRVTQKEAPELFAMINQLRKGLKAPRFHRVLITDDFNACVVQTPRLGVFGWYRNYLVIGLPLMKTLSEEQFRAVLAHEFGHLAGGHGRVSNWIYRLRLSWHRLIDSLVGEGRFGTFLFRRFFNWYVPYFTAYSFPLARANEYEADAAAARLTSPQAIAEALTAVNVVGRYLDERYWSDIHRSASDLPRPAFAPYGSLADKVSGGLQDQPVADWVEHALQRETSSDDTHPALADRLRALQQGPLLSLPGPDARADRLLGPALSTITEELDCRWEAAVLPAWEERYQTATRGRERLRELDALLQQGTELSPQDGYDHACLTEEYGAGEDAALPLFRALYAQAPDQPVVSYALGLRLLQRDDDEGLALVEKATELDEDAELSGYEVLRDYCWRRGREEAAHAWHDRLLERHELLQRARAERDQITLKDTFDPHGLDQEQLAALRAQLRAMPGLRRVYLLRKRVALFPERPLFVLGYSCTRWWGLYRRKKVDAIGQRLVDEIQLPGEVFVLSTDGDNYRFGRKFWWKRGARVR